MRLDVPNSRLPIGAYGELKFAYTLHPGTAAAAMALNPSPLPLTTVEFEGGRPKQIRKRLSALGATSDEIRRNLRGDLAIVEANRAALRALAPLPRAPKRIAIDTRIKDHVWRMDGNYREGSLRADIASASREHPRSGNGALRDKWDR